MIQSITSFSSRSVQGYAQSGTKDGAFADLLDVFDADLRAGNDSKANVPAGNINLNPLDFEDAFDSGSLLSDLIDGLLESILSFRKGQPGEGSQEFYPFCAAFTATFGSSGPLIDWINRKTEQLDLTLEQNLALQHIAIRYKDTSGSPHDVAAIGAELKAAGIMRA